MPTGTKIAVIVAVILLGAAGLYYAFVAPPASNTSASKPSTSANGLSAQTPSTLAPTIPSVGAPPSSASSTPAVGALGQNPGSSAIPTPTGLPAGTGMTAGREQPGFTPGSLSSNSGGKGDFPGVTGGSRPTAAPAPGAGSGTINGLPVGGTGVAGSNSTSTGTPAAGTTVGTTVGAPRPTSPTPVGTVPNAPVGGTSTGTTGATGSTSPTTPIGSSTATTASSETVHTVASGETLSSIAKRYLGSENAWRAIAKANPTVDPTAMKIGTKLKIPARESGSTASSGGSSGSTTTTASRSAPATGGASGDMHTVASGDTLASIARRYYGNSKYWQRIYDANRNLIGSDPAALKIGQKLSLPSKTAVVGAEKVER
jgi:collagen type I/II/III/V/XI/XXIV/XXVII alpha